MLDEFLLKKRYIGTSYVNTIITDIPKQNEQT